MSDWTLADWAQAAGIGSVVGGALVSVIRWWARRSFVGRDEHDTHVDGIQRRMETIEANQRGLATKDDVASLTVRLTEADGDAKALSEIVRALDGNIRGVRGAVDRIESFLMGART